MRCSPALRRPCWAAGTPIGAVSDLHRDLVRRGLKRPPVQAVVKWYNADKGFGFGLALVAPGSVIALAAYAGAGQVDWRLGIPLAVGGAVAISAGVAFAQSLPERRLRFAFCE
jgi:hypothetical protein